MFKSYNFSTVLAVSLCAAFTSTLTSTLGAWGGQRSPREFVDNKVDIHFPLSTRQAWAMEESLLIWKTYEDDADYALHRYGTNLSDVTSDVKQTLKHPKFNWSTGVRVKLTRYLPSNDPWDVNATGTYYYDQANNTTNVNYINNVNTQNFLQSPWDTVGVGNAVSAKTSTRMNFFTFDLTAGRYYSLTSKIEIHPFIGIRSVLNYQNYKTNYISATGTQPILYGTEFKGSHDFWAVGPRLGTDLSLRFGRHWSLIGTLGASVFGGRYDISETFNGDLNRTINRLEDKDTVLRSNIDASIGLGWEKWVKKNTIRIAPSFVFEVSEWFSMKRWVDIHQNVTDVTNPVIRPHRRYSDLGLMGFNVNLQVDF